MEPASMNEQPKPGLLRVFKSVGAAYFGVQSEKNRARDFTPGNPAHFIVAGLIATVLFVLFLWGMVHLILYLAGA
ncbi:MAG: DUF2970 domain-containing protein [Gammaproteobacteria bacterium]|nr:DUF2970 domain-containing protein [Gammaproteobacteria bacterium]MBA3731131.1 DUF2970 domain-containing protein [Gammaproteobacteria bacterium]